MFRLTLDASEGLTLTVLTDPITREYDDWFMMIDRMNFLNSHPETLFLHRGPESKSHKPLVEREGYGHAPKCVCRFLSGQSEALQDGMEADSQ